MSTCTIFADFLTWGLDLVHGIESVVHPVVTLLTFVLHGFQCSEGLYCELVWV
jgi:hypothetical protein